MSQDQLVVSDIAPEILDKAAKVLVPLGLTVSDACRLFLTRVALEKCLPFVADVPNHVTRQTLDQIEKGQNLHFANDSEDLFKQLGIRMLLPLDV